jgi:hypothetical protein
VRVGVREVAHAAQHNAIYDMRAQVNAPADDCRALRYHRLRCRDAMMATTRSEKGTSKSTESSMLGEVMRLWPRED